MRSERPSPKPLDPRSIERLALHYVERYATTRAKLTAYCARKIRERGWEGEPFDLEALAERFAQLGYVNDRLFAESKASAMGRRGLGARRIAEALRHAGIDEADAAAILPEAQERAVESAIAFAKRRRIGPFGREIADRAMIEKQVGAMVRAGHSPTLARLLAKMAPGTDPSELLGEG